MIRTYRMWRFVRIVEKSVIAFAKDKKNSANDSKKCLSAFTTKRTMILHRNYTDTEAAMAFFMAYKKGYISTENEDLGKNQPLSIEGDGMLFSTISGLLSAESKILAPIGGLTSVLIAAFALYVSIVT